MRSGPAIHPLPEHIAGQPMAAVSAEGRKYLAWLAKRSPALGTELDRLPELSGNMTRKTVGGIETLARIYLADPAAFNHAFEKMNTIGITGKRKFCTPLQALVWITEKETPAMIEPLIRTYDLTNLLRLSWKIDEKKRWNDLDLVTDRLNAPELVDFYEEKFFQYQIDRIDKAQSPEQIFKTRHGDCEDYAIFAAFCLDRAGYCTRVLNTWWGYGLMGHIVCVYEQDCQLWVIDRAPLAGVMPGISGPYDSYVEIGKAITQEAGGGREAKYIWVYEWNEFLSRYRHFPVGESLI